MNLSKIEALTFLNLAQMQCALDLKDRGAISLAARSMEKSQGFIDELEKDMSSEEKIELHALIAKLIEHFTKDEKKWAG